MLDRPFKRLNTPLNCVLTTFQRHLSCLHPLKVRAEIQGVRFWLHTCNLRAHKLTIVTSGRSTMWKKWWSSFTSRAANESSHHTRCLAINNWAATLLKVGSFCFYHLLCRNTSCGKKNKNLSLIFHQIFFIFIFILRCPTFFSLSIPWSPPPNVRRRSWKISCHICHLSRSLMNSFDLSLLCLWPLSSEKSRSRKCLHQRVNSLTCGSVTKL